MKPEFLTRGVLIDFDDLGREGVLKRTVAYRDKQGRIHHALPGLRTDGRSGPVGYYLIGQPFRTRHLRCAIVHDWYCAHADLMDKESYSKMRAACDKLFLESLETVGVPWWKRRLMYMAVRGHAKARTIGHTPAHWSKHFTSAEASHATRPELN